MMIFVKLLLAHLLGDFVLQPNAWVHEKERLKVGSSKLYFHVLLHGLLSLLFIADMQFYKWAIVIVLSHLIIDLSKLYFQKQKNKRQWFWIDQLAHILILIFISLIWQNQSIDLTTLWNNQNVTLITCIVLLTTPTGVFIKTIISFWTPAYNNSLETSSLQNAGKYIGILERLFVFFFIITHHWEGIGFLLATKSIFRFGDLKEARDRKLTEYVMIGTLLSFGIAMLTGTAYFLIG